MSSDSEQWVLPPLSASRQVGDYPVGNMRLAVHQSALLAAQAPGLDLGVDPRAWLVASDLELFLSSGMTLLVGAANEPLVWRRDGPANAESQWLAKDSFLIRHPWDLLRANEQYVSSLAGPLVAGDVHPLAVIEGNCQIGAGTRILPGVFIEGNVIIGEDCKIGPNCYLRGNTSIGDRCHIGQSVEIKNCLILSGTNVGHLSYVGDSVLGEKVNLGAGSTTSNLRHDGRNHRAMVRGELVDTGRRKFGAIIGDGVHTGINTSIYPGRQLWFGSSTRPGDVVVRDLKI
jgi:UDP-N-acetylglucosamine diphosphorylase / glucose-1-phosphate thymidylyltransferase / UDP-N-acetylgalactosamine diphosphorylase / glucosamine-1-phosphate N-acetyltransferase / galactosamine-1-phosphate N-acetyltransferase